MLDLAAIRLHAKDPVVLSLPTNKEHEHLGGSIRGGVGDPYTFYPNLWAWAVGMFRPEVVLDIGCGHGYAVKTFKDLGVTSAIGIDGDSTIVNSAVDGAPILCHDFATEKWNVEASAATDLVWCCEFLEHLDEQHLDNVFGVFRKTKIVIMTHALPGQGGHHHVNEQLPGYWVLQFMKRGFELDDVLTQAARKIAAADKQLLGLKDDSYFMKTGLIFRNLHA